MSEGGPVEPVKKAAELPGFTLEDESYLVHVLDKGATMLHLELGGGLKLENNSAWPLEVTIRRYLPVPPPSCGAKFGVRTFGATRAVITLFSCYLEAHGSDLKHCARLNNVEGFAGSVGQLYWSTIEEQEDEVEPELRDYGD